MFFNTKMSRWKRRENVHLGRNCVSCSVCGADGVIFRHPDNWNEEFNEWIMTSSQLDTDLLMSKV